MSAESAGNCWCTCGTRQRWVNFVCDLIVCETGSSLSTSKWAQWGFVLETRRFNDIPRRTWPVPVFSAVNGPAGEISENYHRNPR